MNRNQRIAHRLSEVLLNGTWIANTNFKTQIKSIDYKEATYKLDNLNTVAALTFHINYYLEGILNVFNGGALNIKDTHSFNVPAIHTQEEWEVLLHSFLSNSEKFIVLVSSMDEALLDTIFVNERYGTYERNIEGVIEHCYYHLGQVVLIRKLIATQHPKDIH